LLLLRFHDGVARPAEHRPCPSGPAEVYRIEIKRLSPSGHGELTRQVIAHAVKFPARLLAAWVMMDWTGALDCPLRDGAPMLRLKLLAIDATALRYFAIAQKCCIAQKDCAFQASSPKTFRPGWQQPGFSFG
jgi:hypothetical protein